MRNLIALAIAGYALSGCMAKGKRTMSDVSTTGDGKAHYLEPVPLNRFPMPSITKNTVAGQPVVELVQKRNGVDYGLRPFANEAQIRGLIKPGDVAIYYNLLTKNSTPMNIAQWGMYHAATVVSNRPFAGAPKKIDESLPDDALCFVHAGQGADCKISFYTHFFRVNYNDPATAATVAEMAGRTIEVIEYDATFTTEILNNNNTLDKGTFAAVKDGTVPAMYCSELPYTLHSTMIEAPLFGGKYVTDIVTEYKDVRKMGEFACPMGTDASVDSLMKYLGQFDLKLSKSQKYLMETAVQQYLSDSSSKGFTDLLRGGALAGIDRLTGRKVMPSDFVKAYHEGNKHLTYIGSWEANAVPIDDQCGAVAQ